LSKADWESFKNNSCKFVTADLISEFKSVEENAECLTNSVTRTEYPTR